MNLLIKGGTRMIRKFEDNEIVKTECGYTVKTEKKYSSMIRMADITVAYSKEREELIIYDQDFIMIKRRTGVETLQEYQYKNVAIVVWNKMKIMVLRDGKCDIIEGLFGQYGDMVTFRNLIDIEPKKYLVIGEYRPFIDVHKYVFFVLNLHNETTLSLITEDSDYCRIGKRFLLCKNLYDLYTMTRMNWPKEITRRAIMDMEVCYSSKQIIVVKMLNNYYVYINGYIVYTYIEKEHEQILLDLYKHHTKTKEYYTVIIKSNMYIWSKKERPQVISISKK